MSAYTPELWEIRLAWLAHMSNYQRMGLEQYADVDDPFAVFDRWLAYERARIWDEGRRSGLTDGARAQVRGDIEPTPNPYRKGGDA